MDPKRELTSVDLVALLSELRGHTGSVVDKAYLYGENLVRLKLRSFDAGRLELLLEVGDLKRAHLSPPEHVPDAPTRPPDFARKLRNRISGAEFAGVEQHGFDRILVFDFRREDQDTTLVVELFGEGNVTILDQDGTVVDCLETVRLKSRTVAPGAQYEFPSERPRPTDYDREAFGATLRESDTDVVRTLATQLDFGGLYGEELCTRAGVEKTKSIQEVTEEEIDAIYAAIEGLFDALEGGLDPRIYEADEQFLDVAPIPLEERSTLETRAADSFMDALDAYFRNFQRDSEESDPVADDGPAFQDEIEKHERIVSQQEQAIEGFDEQAAQEREAAQALYGNYGLAEEICTTIREAREAGHSDSEIEARFEEGAEAGIEAAEAVVGMTPSDGTVTVDLGDHQVTLDPSEGIEQNADRIYSEATRIEEKKAGAKAALADTREQLEELQERQAAAEAAESPPEQQEKPDPDEPTDWLSKASIPLRRPERWFERFRWLRTTDGFLVLGGRNADQNEELVEKYMDPYDRFFHAQAHGGPVTVLKTSDPSEASSDVDVPEASIQQTAQFAVSYSSVWKDGRFAGDVYSVSPDQVSKTPESGEYLEKGGFAIRGDRTYHRDTPVGVCVGIACEPETRVVGGPPGAVSEQAEYAIEVEPGRYAQGDVAKRIYRKFREQFADTSFVRNIASPDRIQHFLPPGTSTIS